MSILLSSLLLFLLSSGSAADAESLFQEAVSAAKSEDYSTALSKFEGALEADPNNIRYGSEYRQIVIATKEYDRCLEFFEKLVTDHPQAANAHLNYGFAYVDKIPDAGAITQVILANSALTEFSRAIELEPSWIGYYTRGNSYLFWPKIFNRTQLGIDDLEKARELQEAVESRDIHVRVYISLGDGYWKLEDLDRARQAWQRGLDSFPANELLKARLSHEGEELEALIGADYDPYKRVDTNLHEIWEKQ